MQSHAGSCGPETLVRLQKVFDAVWLELKARKSPYTFPWATEATRYTIANLVFLHVNEADRDAEFIKRQVLQSFISRE